MGAMGKLLVVVCLVTACASAEKEDQRARPAAAREVVSGGATVRGGGVRMDVQIGRTFVQKPSRSAGTTAKSGAVVTTGGAK